MDAIIKYFVLSFQISHSIHGSLWHLYCNYYYKMAMTALRTAVFNILTNIITCPLGNLHSTSHLLGATSS